MSALSVGPSELFTSPSTVRSRVSPSTLPPSTFTLATMSSIGTTGFSARNAEPSSPLSSAVTKAMMTERCVRSPRESCREIASRFAVPEALSSAPL